MSKLNIYFHRKNISIYFHGRSPQLNLPCLSDKDRVFMGKPFSLSELTKAMKLLTSNKSPMEDGFPPPKFTRNLRMPILMEAFKIERE